MSTHNQRILVGVLKAATELYMPKYEITEVATKDRDTYDEVIVTFRRPRDSSPPPVAK